MKFFIDVLRPEKDPVRREYWNASPAVEAFAVAIDAIKEPATLIMRDWAERWILKQTINQTNNE